MEMQVKDLTSDSLNYIELYISRKRKLDCYLSLNTNKCKMFLLIEDEDGTVRKKVVYNEENEFESMVESLQQSVEDLGTFPIEIEE